MSTGHIFACPNCGREFELNGSSVGQVIPCAGCGVELDIPSDDAVTDDADDSPMVDLGRHEKHPEDLIDMTAMVDIVFFLLIFFLVTSLQALEAVMKMPTPETATGKEAKVMSMADYENDSDVVVIRIDADDSIWVDDQQMNSPQDLRVRLRDSRQANDRLNTALVAANGDASHGATVVCFDACASVGIETVSYTVEEEEE